MSNAGAPRKWDYDGEKKIRSIRLTDDEVELIKNNFETLQEFIQHALDVLKKRKGSAK
jgi:malate/lactate dehydrogenase